jgi:hypothetical protein
MCDVRLLPALCSELPCPNFLNHVQAMCCLGLGIYPQTPKQCRAGAPPPLPLGLVGLVCVGHIECAELCSCLGKEDARTHAHAHAHAHAGAHAGFSGSSSMYLGHRTRTACCWRCLLVLVLSRLGALPMRHRLTQSCKADTLLPSTSSQLQAYSESAGEGGGGGGGGA